jgi:hypothetical protein
MAQKRGLWIAGLLVSLISAIPSPGQNSIGIACPSEARGRQRRFVLGGPVVGSGR